LTDRFELVLLDDASTDATGETARELSLSYPQVQLLTQSTPLGPVESFRSGIRFTHGELLLFATDRPAFDLHEIGKLWERRKDDGAVWAKASVVGRLGSIPRPPASLSTSGDASAPDLLLVPRRLLTGWTMRGERSDAVAYLRHRGYVVERFEFRAARHVAAPRSKFTGELLAKGPVVAPRPNLLQAKLRGVARTRTV
jgi:glycosyltransferase involved in cell wall biosynthesis